jgi:CheY-like chemotaxis protein
LRVLVVEDSLPNLKLLMMMVRSLGYTVSGAEHGGLCVDQFEAAKRAREEAGLPAPGPDDPPGQGWPADCVLLDGSMPVLNGPQTATHLRGMGVRIPIIAVTGNALADDMQSFLDAGADMVLTKPIRIDAIKAILAKVARPTAGTQ